jgi:hypothetical protein
MVRIPVAALVISGDDVADIISLCNETGGCDCGGIGARPDRGSCGSKFFNGVTENGKRGEEEDDVGELHDVLSGGNLSGNVKVSLERYFQ